MKRNNLFFLSYIIFIFVCAAVRIFWDFPLWSAIVAAITTASCIFAFADMFKSQSEYQRAISSEQYEYAEYALDEIEMIKKANSARLKQSDTFIDYALYSKDDQVKHYESSQQNIEDIENGCKSIKLCMTFYKVIAMISNGISVILYMAGFLALLCIIVFEPVAKLVIDSQELMTVWSFGIILFTQYYDGVSAERRKKNSDNIKASKDALDAIRTSIESEVVHNAN